MTTDATAPAGEAVPAGKLQIHPLAALTEAQFDNEIARNRRLMLAQQVYELTQLVGQQAQRMAELEAELAEYMHQADETDLAGYPQSDDTTGDT